MFVLLSGLVLQSFAFADGLELRFRPLFDEIPLGDVVFYEVSLKNNSPMPITIQRPSVGHNVHIETMGLLCGDKSIVFGPTNPLPEPIDCPEDTWTLKPGENKSSVLLVNLWVNPRITFSRELRPQDDRCYAIINSQPLGEYRDVVVEFAPFVEMHQTSTAIISRQALSLVLRRLAENGFDLNQRLLHFRHPTDVEIIVDGVIKYGNESLIRKHCEMQVEIRSWVKESLSEEVMQARIETLVQGQRAPLQAWYRNRIQEELKALQIGHEERNSNADN
jgi:hypothetical protein